MPVYGQDTLKSRRTFEVDNICYDYYSLEAVGNTTRLPYALKVLLENLLRFENGRNVTVEDIRAIIAWQQNCHLHREIVHRPARVIMQDFTGVPAVVDLAAMRDAMVAAGGSPKRVNPLIPVDLVIDHSLMVDYFGVPTAKMENMAIEFQRNIERYTFLRWGQVAFDNFHVVPPGMGICHQINLEYLAQCVWVDRSSETRIAYPETVVGTDSHTTMINGLAVLGWGVGGIEAEAAILGQPISMLIPDVVGVRLYGFLHEGVTATDLVLTITQRLRQKGVVGKFVEFFGPGLAELSLADRATVSNMAPEYGATCGIFPIDRETINYLTFTGRDSHQIKLVEAYARIQGMWYDATVGGFNPLFTDVLEFNLSTVEASLAGPHRPQELVALPNAQQSFSDILPSFVSGDLQRRVPVAGECYTIGSGDIVIAAITSCTNTSNPSAMVAAGLLARKAVEYGLMTKPWVKTSLAPGSQIVTDYLTTGGLQSYLDRLGFQLVGYGCTTCIGNAGPLAASLVKAIDSGNLVTVSILSGNRNFEGRISPHTRANYLASPPLVVAYALAGSMTIDLTRDALGTGTNGQPVFLRDIWPTTREIQEVLKKSLTPEMFRARYADVFTGPPAWQKITTSSKVTYNWDPASTYVRSPPYFLRNTLTHISDITSARCLVLLGDSVTTDHISPAGSIPKTSPAGLYLQDHGVTDANFNSYGSRRGNHEVMMRGTFANIRIRNEMLSDIEGGTTVHKDGAVMSIYEAAMRYKDERVPLIVIAGKEYGTGSSRDWAAKGPALLGVRAVIAESFERIHRSNLIGMGLLPLQFKEGEGRKHLHLDGSECFDIVDLDDIKPLQEIMVVVHRSDGCITQFLTLCRIDTMDEMAYYCRGGIMNYVVDKMIKEQL